MAKWERFYKIARRNVVCSTAYFEFESKSTFLEELTNYAIEELFYTYVKEGREADPYWIEEESYKVVDEYYEKAKPTANYWEEGQPFGISGGIELGDYTYHVVEVEQDNPYDDWVSIEMVNIGRRN